MSSVAQRVQILSEIIKGFPHRRDLLSENDGIKLAEEDIDLAEISADAEAVFFDNYRGNFKAFFEAFFAEIQRALTNGDDPIEEVGEWLKAEIGPVN